jgi:hypothetical protein
MVINELHFKARRLIDIVIFASNVDRPFSTGGQLMCHEEMHHQMQCIEDFWFYKAVFGPTLIFVLGISAPLRGLIM